MLEISHDSTVKSTHESIPMQTWCGQGIFSCVGDARGVPVCLVLLLGLLRLIWAIVSTAVEGSVAHVAVQDRQWKGLASDPTEGRGWEGHEYGRAQLTVNVLYIR